MRPEFFFDGWLPIARVIVIAAAVYVLVTATLRLIGQRALAKMSAYDLIVTIALGSLVASIPLQKSLSLADGIAAIATFLALQHLTSYVLRRWRPARRIVKGAPTLVLWDGTMLEDRMDAIDVTEGEVRAAVRTAGMASVSHALAVVLEDDGNWSVIGSDDPGDLSALEPLGPPWPLDADKRNQAARESRARRAQPSKPGL